jgi:hypothetical protein
MNFGQGAVVAAVPEPNCLVLSGAAAIVLLKGRRARGKTAWLIR